jgi:hypothetical protein
MRHAKNDGIPLIEDGARESESANALGLAPGQRNPTIEVLSHTVTLALIEPTHS